MTGKKETPVNQQEEDYSTYDVNELRKQIRSVRKKLLNIAEIEKKQSRNAVAITKEQLQKLNKKENLEEKLCKCQKYLSLLSATEAKPSITVSPLSMVLEGKEIFTEPPVDKSAFVDNKQAKILDFKWKKKGKKLNYISLEQFETKIRGLEEKSERKFSTVPVFSTWSKLFDGDESTIKEDTQSVLKSTVPLSNTTTSGRIVLSPPESIQSSTHNYTNEGIVDKSCLSRGTYILDLNSLITPKKVKKSQTISCWNKKFPEHPVSNGGIPLKDEIGRHSNLPLSRHVKVNEGNPWFINQKPRSDSFEAVLGEPITKKD